MERKEEKKKPQANISFLSTDSTYVGYSGAAEVEYVFPSWFFLIPNLSVLFNVFFLSMVTLHKQFPCWHGQCKTAINMHCRCNVLLTRGVTHLEQVGEEPYWGLWVSKAGLLLSSHVQGMEAYLSAFCGNPGSPARVALMAHSGDYCKSGEEKIHSVFLLSLAEGEGLCNERVATVIRYGLWAWAIPCWEPKLQSLEAKKVLAPEGGQALQAAGSRGKAVQALSLFESRKQASCGEPVNHEFSCGADPNSATAQMCPDSVWSQHPQDAQKYPLFTYSCGLSIPRY